MQDRSTFQSDSPIFVFGALRSGTTVFRLMLDAHPGLCNPGEVDFLFDLLFRDRDAPGGWRYQLDMLSERRVFQSGELTIPEGKDGLDLLHDLLHQYQPDVNRPLTLNIHRNLAMLLEVLPKARIIHIMRDPRDVARSSIGMGWAGTLYHGVGQWISCEQEWDRTAERLDPLQFIDLRYEDLIRNPEIELRRVCTFIGVEFDPEMLSYHRDTTYSAPDPSLIEQWRRKSTQDEVSLVEGRAEDLMRSRGYEIAGNPRLPGRVENLKLGCQNRILIWRQAISRYGLGLFLMEKLARRLGLRSVHDHCRSRMRNQDLALLK